MNKKIIVFAGTREGREICEFLSERSHTNKWSVTACVATSYGSFCMEAVEGVEILEGRLEVGEIQELMSHYDYVIDATHPYAQMISANIESAHQNLVSQKKIRIIREEQEEKGEVFLDFESVCTYLNEQEGNVLVTTGSKDLKYFQKVKNYEKRIFPRVLPAMESLKNALELGMKPSNIICMQGPFSLEMNVAMIKNIDAKYMVSKETGKSGGFEEKLQAAKLTGVRLLTIGRPNDEDGLTVQEAKKYLESELNI